MNPAMLTQALHQYQPPMSREETIAKLMKALDQLLDAKGKLDRINTACSKVFAGTSRHAFAVDLAGEILNVLRSDW